MRLLPDQVGFKIRRSEITSRTYTLGPARAFIALILGHGFSLGQNALVVRKAALQQFTATPQWKMRRVPPVHLKMKFAEPAVTGKSSLLRRQRATTLNARE